MFRFFKKYKLDTENLAIPEIHTNKVKSKRKKNEDREIDYNNLAMPEIHIEKFYKKGKNKNTD